MQNPTESARMRVSATLASGVRGSLATAWPDDLVDTFQRSALFLALLRRRSNQEAEMKAEPATVLRYEHEVLPEGKSLKRPMNCTLSRSVPPAGIVTDPQNLPVAAIDPRAGH